MPTKATSSDQYPDSQIQTTTPDQSDAAEINTLDDDMTDTDDSEEEQEEENFPNVVWTGYGKKIPVLIFKAESVVSKKPELRAVGDKYHMAYKLVKTECKLVRSILNGHGFHEAHPNSNDYNLMWTGSHLKPYVLRSLQEFQKVNHFPRSYEVTRKDRLYKNVQRMQQTKGYRHFDFVPQSFVVPGEFQEFCSAYLKDKGPWIVKPIASSRGRGIFLVNHPEQVPLDDTLIVSRYLNNPLVIDGFKFDVRLYVAVTSFDPLTVYLYEEGLTRFATVKYEKSGKAIRNQCMHLTNYSVNKKSNDYVKNDDPDVEDYGNKWSLGAMLRYMRSMGRDTTAMMMRIEDVIIKTLISAELPIATACKMFMPYKGNCFELYGFDILVDDNLKPWVLEVNLSPSLACDAPLDLKIKSNMISDLFSLTGFMCQDPMVRKAPLGQRGFPVKPGRAQSGRPLSAASNRSQNRSASSNSLNTGLTSEEIRVVRRAKEENQRRGGWVRIFPTPDSWDLYSNFLQYTTSLNLMLHQQLFPNRNRGPVAKPGSAMHSTTLSKARTLNSRSTSDTSQVDEGTSEALQRSLQYERKLASVGERKKKKTTKSNANKSGAPVINGAFKGRLVQGVPEDVQSVPSSSSLASHSDTNLRSDPITTSQTAAKPSPESQSTQHRADSAEPQQQQPSQSQHQQPHSQPHSSHQHDQQQQHSQQQQQQQHDSQQQPQQQQQSQEQPKYLQSQPVYDVVILLEKGKIMSKVQARFAFATYLSRVQQRLMTETSTSETEDGESANEQMDLVLRFLKRAAGNLQQPFKVVVPSRKLLLNDRRRILSKQLAEFVHIYSRETEQLKQRSVLEKKHLRRPPTASQNDGLDDYKFDRFVNTASETELEDVLTTYTKLNKSASIFLGSNSKSTYEHRPAANVGAAVNASHSDPSLLRRKESMENLAYNQPSGKTVPHSENVLKDTTSDANRQMINLAGTPQSPYRNGMSSYVGAVHVYSAKLASPGPPTRQRPHSASPNKLAGNNYSLSNGNPKGRPASAALGKPPTNLPQRERPDGAEAATYDEEAANMLHRLSQKQQQRHYKASSVLVKDAMDGGRTRSASLGSQTTKERDSRPSNGSVHGDTNGNVLTRNNVVCAVESESGTVNGNGSVKSEKRRNSHGQSANDTFNSFIQDSNQHSGGEFNAAALAYSQVTGVKPASGENYSPTPGSSQQQQMSQQQQQQLIHKQQMLEQSKAKHQAMVAQAHEAQRSRNHHAQPAAAGTAAVMPPGAPIDNHHQAFVPRPPSKPPSNKKPASSHRIARTNFQDTDLYDSQLYNSFKYDSNTEPSKAMYSSFNSAY